MSRICVRPPALNGALRAGLANRRSLATCTRVAGLAAGTETFGLAGAGAALGGATWRPELAGWVGVGAFLGRPTPRAPRALETFSGRGTGYSCASLARCP